MGSRRRSLGSRLEGLGFRGQVQRVGLGLFLHSEHKLRRHGRDSYVYICG